MVLPTTLKSGGLYACAGVVSRHIAATTIDNPRCGTGFAITSLLYGAIGFSQMLLKMVSKDCRQLSVLFVGIFTQNRVFDQKIVP